jgi:curved DNA-binding protein CbpA
MKKAYRKGMIKCHPDKVPPEERSKAMEKSNMLQNAFNCLSDPWERYLYDHFGLKRYLQNSKVIQCFKNYLLSGIELTKHPRKGYPRKRFFWITPDFEWFMTGRERILEPTAAEREEMKGVRISDIHEITRGITTEVFEKTGKPRKQSRYFSIITTERTLDLECESKERCDFLVSRISLLVLDTQKNKKWLQRHFELKALKEAAEATQKAQSGGSFAPKPPQESNPNNNPDGSPNGEAPAPEGANADPKPEPKI